ncbi:MAG: right-handed parallel beta-helix repeat-containing protein [Victivallales bacterium]|nr:right-handed parallel beta-helix repeat-containing protein [Victivallales bacterium]
MMIKRIFSIAWLLASWLVLGAPVAYYVDGATGNDEFPGEESAPFRTLRRALRQYRMLAITRCLPEGGVRIVLAPGRYEMASGRVFNEDESASPDCPLEIDGQGKAVFTGSLVLQRSDFVPVADEAVLKRLPQSARGNVQCCDLTKYGIPAEVVADVFRGPFPFGQLFVNGRRQPMSRWPNVGWAAMGNAVERGDYGKAEGQGGIFTYTDETPAERWKTASAVWLHGFWAHDWLDEVIQVESIDGASKRIRLKSAASRYGIGNWSPRRNREERRFAALNLLEELDRCGEWCFEPENARLYAWLPDNNGDTGEIIEFSRLKTSFFKVENCSGIRFSNLIFECSNGPGLELEGNDNAVVGCVFRNLSGTGIIVNGSRNRVESCDIYDLDGTGVTVDGGDTISLVRGENVVQDCHIHHIGKAALGYSAAVRLGGVGNRVSHNLFHDMPHAAVLISGNEQLVEANEIFSACLETSESGALYSTRNWGSQGNVERHNYIHDLGGVGSVSPGVYFDDCDSGDTVEGNVFVGLDRAVMIGGGRDNRILGNVFFDCHPALFMDERGKYLIKWNKGEADSWDLQAKLEAVNYRQASWSVAYPSLSKIMEDEPAKPKHNVASGNIVVGGTGFMMKDPLRKLLTDERNWFMDISSTPGFADARKGDFTLTDMVEVRKHIPNFADIPFQSIGLKSRRSDSHALLEASLKERSLKSRIAPAQPKNERPVGPKGRFTAAVAKNHVNVDGDLLKEEWNDTVVCGRVRLENDEYGVKRGPPSTLYAMAGDGGLWFAFDVSVSGRQLVLDGDWGETDGVELALLPPGSACTLVYRGLANGQYHGSDNGGANKEQLRQFMTGVLYHAKDYGGGMWCCEWFIPWNAMGGRPPSGTAIGFNAAVRQAADGRWQLWRASGSRTSDVQRTGELVIP